MTSQKVLIIGGGFGGIQTALDLAKSASKDLEIVLISDRNHFEYYPGLHSYISVDGPLPYVSVPLADIFGKTQVKIVQGTVIASDPTTKSVTLESGETLSGDYLVYSIGSESTFFNIPGIDVMAFPFQNITEAAHLREHIEILFEKHCVGKPAADCVVGLHFVIIGAGPNGVDLAGELSGLTRALCKKNNLLESFVTIDLIEGAGGVLPMFPKNVQDIAMQRLRLLGVNVLCNRQLQKQGNWTVVLSDMTLGAKTVIWTAGITTNQLVKKIPGLTLAKKDRVTVTDHLTLPDHPEIYVVGDAGDTQYSGLAQTAIHTGSYVAKSIIAKTKGKEIVVYVPKSVAYNIGVGHGWSITKVGNIVISGKISSIIRKIIDLKYFLSILPLSKVIKMNPLGKQKIKNS